MWAVHLFFGRADLDFRPRAESAACWLPRGLKITVAAAERRLAKSCSAESASIDCLAWPKSTLKRYDEEVALIRRFARNYDINFRVFSKRHRPTSGAHEAWATKFLERFDTARAAAAAHSEDNNG